ncbi:unnamed protein product [Phytophthora fragariaefolia]|uniref:Unnamed protein product n=1 Tax=Phytophthora fragariaefolia TaxID=1490495 RepID=A0A9W6XTZ3_9STRA|nr:unnamed protein product [Phytophthora fragariaefolia]
MAALSRPAPAAQRDARHPGDFPRPGDASSKRRTSQASHYSVAGHPVEAEATHLVQRQQPLVVAGCPSPRCLWADRDGVAVAADAMVTQFLQDEGLHTGPSEFRRRMEAHVDYLEQVHQHAAARDWAFSYAMGVNSRHLYHDGDRRLSPADFVAQEQDAARRQRQRRLTEQRRLSNSTLELRETLDWCSTDNSHNASICTDVKSQNQCGSCWAFAAADSIETAVAVASGSAPQSLSPQQFLECSSREMTSTFDYCWAKDGVDGSSWLQAKMIWGSKNNGCSGGMTHAAFADASQLHWSLLSQLDLPYNEEDTSQASAATLEEACNNSSTDDAAASISGWEQVVGTSCDISSDATELLKLALQKQPISVAINSGGSFDAYKGGVYTCPNDGDFASSGDIDHALVLVGYGSSGSTDYWILKNSYGSSWGEKGFVRLAMDSKINCGLSVFPVIPIGALAGPARTVVDGGGAVEFVGMSPHNWIVLGIIVSVATFFLTTIGAIYASRQPLPETVMKSTPCYVDAQAVGVYERHAGQEFQVSELVTGSTSEVFYAWLRDVWLAGGNQVHEGIGRGCVGSVRRVPLGVEEEILAAGLPDKPAEDQDATDARIPTICYRVRKSGPFPLKSHLAMVRFLNASDAADSTPKTLVVWTVKTEMSRTCSCLHCGGLVRLIFRTALKSFLRSLAKSSAKLAAKQSMRQSHVDPTRYVDAQAFQEYQSYVGQELVVSECVVGSPSEVFDAWLEQVWLAEGSQLHEGVGRGYVGHKRRVALGIEEEILSAGLPIDEEVDSDGGRPSLAAARRDRSKIPSICYKIRNFGVLPLQDHLAFVQFVDVAASPESTPATLVIWSLKTEPTALGYLLCCGSLVKLLLRSALQGFLATLAASAAARADRHLE